MSDLNFNFTADQLAAILPTNTQSAEWFDVLTTNLPVFDISTVNRVAAFIAQCAHESAELTHLHENLNYKAASLIAVWPHHFDASNAAQYEHNPEKIANRAYANRNGNGDEASGDGYKYRGRGPIQITGKDNYAACSNSVYGDTRLLDTPELLETDMDAAIKSAGWFWTSHNLNQYIDNNDFLSTTKRINGGTIGEDDREARYNNALSVLQGA